MLQNDELETLTPKKGAQFILRRQLEVASYDELIREFFPGATDREVELVAEQLKKITPRLGRLLKQ